MRLEEVITLVSGKVLTDEPDLQAEVAGGCGAGAARGWGEGGWGGNWFREKQRFGALGLYETNSSQGGKGGFLRGVQV